MEKRSFDRSYAFRPPGPHSLGHEILLSALAEKIHDNRFLRNILQSGYLEDWEWNATLRSTGAHAATTGLVGLLSG
jgi:hypothetical protein